MSLRFKIQNLLVVTALVALFCGFYAPELRSLDRNARLTFVVSGVILSVSLVSFTPVWIVLYWLRKRSQARPRIGLFQYATVFAAYLASLGIIVGIFLAIRWFFVQ